MRTLPIVLGALVVGCSRPPEEPPPPLPVDVAPGITGEYTIIAGDWSYDERAYTYRYRHAFGRVSVFALPSTRADRLRIRMPPGWGPPIDSLASQLAITELELYEAGDPTVYKRTARENLLRRPQTRITSSSSGHGAVGDLRDGVIVAPLDGDHWASEQADLSPAVDIDLGAPATFNQLVVYWPTFLRPGEWLTDVTITDGYRAQRLEIEVRIDGNWRGVSAEEVRPDERHDGAFIAASLGLDEVPVSRLDHLQRLTAWRALTPPSEEGARAGEIVIDGKWRIVADTGRDSLGALAAGDLITTFTTLGSDVRRLAAAGDAVGSFTIKIGSSAAFRNEAVAAVPEDERDHIARVLDTPQGHALIVRPECVLAVGHEPLGARYAACLLEDRLLQRGGPHLLPETTGRTPRFQPRAVASVIFGGGGPDELGFPDEYLSAIVHAYADGIYIFQNGPYLNDATSLVGSTIYPELTGDADKLSQLGNLVRRAGRQGLRVYWCVTVPGALPRDFYVAHPEVRGDHPAAHAICIGTDAGQAFVRDSIRRLLSAVPDLGGLVVLRSEISHSCGGRAACAACRARYAPDDDPGQQIFRWVREEARAVSPSTEVIAFDWRGGNLDAPREPLLPDDVAMLVRPDSMSGSPENSLLSIGPHQEFIDLGASARPTRKIWVEQQFSHPFPLHPCPEVAVADLYWDKLGRIRAVTDSLRAEGPLPGFFMGNGSGYLPTAMQDLVFRHVMWDPLPDRDVVMRSAATRWYGEALAPNVVQIWHTLSGATFSLAQFDKYLSRYAAMVPPGVFDAQLEDEPFRAIVTLTGIWQESADSLASFAERAPARHRERARWDARLARAVTCNLVSVRHATEWMRHFGKQDVLELPIDHPDAATARRIVRDELRNVETLLELYQTESLLRVHPFWRNWFSFDVVEKKRAHLDRARTRWS